MTSLIKNQVLKHLTKFFKDLAPEQLQLSAFKGSCELSNLQLEEKVLMELLSFPSWIRINKAACDQLAIRIPWTKIKSVPIQMNLNEVTVEVEVCEEFRDISANETDELNNQLANLINTVPGKYGFVDRVIDGITVTVNNILISFKSKLMSATFNLSRVLLESRCPNWKPGELSLTRIKDTKRGQILLFKVVDWQTMRLEAKCLTDPNQAPLRLITNHAQCRLTIKKNLDDCSVVAARIFVIFEDILWVLTFAQFTSAASFVEYIFSLIKRSPMSKKTGILENQTTGQQANANTTATGGATNQAASFISPLNTPIHTSQTEKVAILSGNLSSASLLEQKFLCYDLIETSLHLFIDKVDAHLYDDIEMTPNSKNNRDSGGALQTTLDQIQVDCYPYSRAISDRRHWYKWFDPSPNSRKQWLRSHFAEFDLARAKRFQKQANQQFTANHLVRAAGANPLNSNPTIEQIMKEQTPTSSDEQLLSLTVLVKVKDYCMNCVATKHSARGVGLNKFIETDKDYHMPTEMPALYLELNYFYYYDAINHMMVYDNVPDPLAFIHLSPTKILFDSPTLVFLNSFHVNLSKAFVHLNDLFPEETTAPKIHCRVEILMPQIILPAKSNSDQPVPVSATSCLLVKSGKITLGSSLNDKDVISKLLSSIEKLKENPSQPINLGGSYQVSKDNPCSCDWTKVWNASLVNGMSDFSIHNQLWTIQFEPVWMDFLNYDVDTLASGQRLEPIVEPVNAYAFIHLDLSSTFPDRKANDKSEQEQQSSSMQSKVRDVISILFSVVDGSIMANMDKIQFGFLQRLGMHVEKLIQQIREDASSIIKLETVVEDTLEINLTAYIKEIKARLILDKKIDVQTVSVNESLSASYRKPSLQSSENPKLPPVFKPFNVDEKQLSSETSKGDNLGENAQTKSSVFNIGPAVANPIQVEQPSDRSFASIGRTYTIGETPSNLIGVELDSGPLDECVEVADDASCLFLGDNSSRVETSHSESASNVTDVARAQPSSSSSSAIDATSAVKNNGLASGSLGSLRSSGKSPIEESLLIDLDEMEQSSQLFAKMDLKSNHSPRAQVVPAASKTTVEQEDSDALKQSCQAPLPPQQQQQDIETESISYLELSMSQLMVRRITETKRRQKF